ncbi:hypothetical protein MTR_2g461720 [Medicago truncatula]|uniref:Uncharacterized protein n=1 Tax=Medicago truncatula TaxID=3880 RepID=A0A072V9P9_MEDTR|nr:hypothetical protein MTR_2g461720 [Medicago truncatula]
MDQPSTPPLDPDLSVVPSEVRVSRLRLRRRVCCLSIAGSLVWVSSSLQGDPELLLSRCVRLDVFLSGGKLQLGFLKVVVVLQDVPGWWLRFWAIASSIPPRAGRRVLFGLYFGAQKSINLDVLCRERMEWDFDKIVELFSTEGVHAIIQTSLFPSVQEDKVVWQEESNGLYSVRSGYRIAAWEVVPSTHYYVQGEWNAIWKVQAPHKAQNLLRRICRARESWFSSRLSDMLLPRLSLFQSMPKLIFDIYRKESANMGGCIAVLLWQLWAASNDVVWNSSRVTDDRFMLTSDYNGKCTNRFHQVIK